MVTITYFFGDSDTSMDVFDLIFIITLTLFDQKHIGYIKVE